MLFLFTVVVISFNFWQYQFLLKGDNSNVTDLLLEKPLKEGFRDVFVETFQQNQIGEQLINWGI